MITFDEPGVTFDDPRYTFDGASILAGASEIDDWLRARSIVVRVIEDRPFVRVQ